MSDILITSNSELMVFQAEAQNEAAIDFIDGFLPADAHLVVVDSGRIVLPAHVEAEMTAAAKQAGLTVEREGAKRVAPCPTCGLDIVQTGDGRHPCAWCGNGVV